MPHCPGCERVVSYSRLPTHLHYCDDIDASNSNSRNLEALADEIARTNDRLSQRVQRLEMTLERQLVDADPRERNSP